VLPRFCKPAPCKTSTNCSLTKHCSIVHHTKTSRDGDGETKTSNLRTKYPKSQLLLLQLPKLTATLATHSTLLLYRPKPLLKRNSNSSNPQKTATLGTHNSPEVDPGDAELRIDPASVPLLRPPRIPLAAPRRRRAPGLTRGLRVQRLHPEPASPHGHRGMRAPGEVELYPPVQHPLRRRRRRHLRHSLGFLTAAAAAAAQSLKIGRARD
jgi:hypothetical protein